MKIIKSILFISFFTGGHLLSSDKITIKQNIPDNVQPGSEFTVEITFSKGAYSGFGKFTHDFPEGFVVTSGESYGGNFSFTDKKVKIIWFNIPKDPAEFKVSYKVRVPSSVNGQFYLTGKFSYVENKEKFVVELEEKNITAGKSAKPASNENTAMKTSAATPGTSVKPTGIAPAASQPESNISASTSPASATGTTTTSADDLTKPSSDQVVYMVQFGVFSKQLSSDKTAGLPEVHYIKENNLYKYFSGKFSSPQAAEVRKRELVQKGQKGSIIVGYKDGIRVEVIK